MNTRKQITISAAIVGVAALALAAFTRQDTAHDAEEGAMGGHDHAAMLAAGGDELSPVRLDGESARRIGLAFAAVERGPLSRQVRVPGIVTIDETRLVDLSPRLEGWAEEVYVDFTGAPVRRGDPLLAIYSPELIAAQEELILARRLADEVAGTEGRAAKNARELLEAARRRLEYWGIAADQIEAIERQGAPERALVIRAPAGGLVVEKNVVRGSRVLPGTNLYRIADLARVWVEGEVFEKDLGVVRVGQGVRVGVEAYPGQEFEGRVAYIHPIVSAESRTGRIRIELANPELALKPGMYASVTFEAEVQHDGLHIPRSAVLTTGTRSLVFVRAADGSLVPREVMVGPAAGDRVAILAGLEAGERVVSAANFLVDAEANLGMALEEMEHEGHDGAADGHDGHGGGASEHGGGAGEHGDGTGGHGGAGGVGDHGGHAGDGAGAGHDAPAGRGAPGGAGDQGAHGAHTGH